MRLTKNKQNLRNERSLQIRRKNISTDLEYIDYSNQINEQGGLYLQKLLKTNDGYQSINNKQKIGSNNFINFDRNMQSNFSSDEKRQKAINFIINSINEKNKDKYKKINVIKNNYNNYNSYNDIYNNYTSEQNIIDNSKSQNNFIGINKLNDLDYNNNNDNIYMRTPKREYENNIKYNIYNNDINKNLFTAQKQIENIYRNNFNNINNIDENIFKKNDESSGKKYEKTRSINQKQKFFRKLKITSEERNIKKDKLPLDNQLINRKKIIEQIPSPKASNSNRQFSPFNDILSKSTNGFFINKIPITNNNEKNNNLPDLTVNNEYKKSSFRIKKNEDNENASIYKHINNNYYTNNDSNINKFLLTTDNINEAKNNRIIYRNKQVINQKLFQSNSQRNDSNRNKYKKKLIINYRLKNKYENDIQDENDFKIHNEFDINEINDDKTKNININDEELKKYINYFIKDITPININQFVIYSHSNNNFKSNENVIKNDETTKIISFDNKNCSELNKSQEIRLNKKISKNSNEFIQEFNHITFKNNLLEINNRRKMNKILVKKRPLNDINNYQSNNESIYTGFTISKIFEGESILNLPINIDNLSIINEFLKESGFEINQIKTKENIKPKKIELTNKKEDNTKKIKKKLNKEKQYSNIEAGKMTNRKEKSKTFIIGLNEENKGKNTSVKQKLKKTPTKVKENSKPNTIKAKKTIKKLKDNNIKGNVVLKMKEKIEEYENINYNDIKDKINLKDDLNKIINKNLMSISTPNFYMKENSKK